MVAEKPQLKEINLRNVVQEHNENSAGDPILPAIPSFFKIARFKGIKDDKIHLETDSTEVLTAVCGDDCSVNLKRSRSLESTYGIKSPFSRCASHTSYGTIRRLCTSERACQVDAKNLYENQRKLLKHFSMSPKISELLSNALAVMEMHDVHLLNWGSTRITRFLDTCVQLPKSWYHFLIQSSQTIYDLTRHSISQVLKYVNIIFFKCVKLI